MAIKQFVPKKLRASISRADHVYAVNEWWRRYRDEPERFGREFQQIVELNAAEAEGREPTLGETDYAYMNQLLDERDALRKQVADGVAKAYGRKPRNVLAKKPPQAAKPRKRAK